MKFKRSFPLLLAAGLQAMPLARCALPLQSLVAGPSWACVLKLAGAVAAFLGACDAVSGASEIVPPYVVNAELGHPYIRVLGTSGQFAYEWSADTTPLDSLTYPLAPGLFLTNSTGFIGGVPTQAGTFNAIIIAWLFSGSSYSAFFTLNITNGGPPGLFNQPASQTNDAGSTASFAISAYGKLPLSYQWQFNGNSIPGATSNTYSIADAQQSQGGTYGVTVTNSLGHISSSNATLVVNSAVNAAPFVLQPTLENQTFTISFPAMTGANYTIQSSADLINWVSKTNVTASASAVLFSDFATNSVLFYRAWHP